jgi:hypothetical protein
MTTDDQLNDDIVLPRLSPTVGFPSLINDRQIQIRNAYVNGKHICSEFILMIEHKETMAVSCYTYKSKTSIDRRTIQ